MKNILKISFIIISCFSYASIYAQDAKSFAGKSKEELFAWSIETPALEEKIKLRGYLAANFPNTSEGETCKEWLDDQDGFTQKAGGRYLTVIREYPGSWLAITNSYFYYTKENVDLGIANFEKMLSVDPLTITNLTSRKIFNLLVDDALRNLFFLLNDNPSYKSKAQEKLTYWELKLGKEWYMFDFIRGLEAEITLKDYKLAETYYLSALDKKDGKNEIEIWTRLISLKKDKLFDNEKKSVNDQFTLFQPLIAEANGKEYNNDLSSKSFISQAFEFVGDYLADYDYKMALECYSKSLKAYPVYKVLEKALKLRGKYGELQESILDDALEQEAVLPMNDKLEYYIGYKYLFLNNSHAAEQYFQKSIDNSTLWKDKFSHAKNLSFIYNNIYFDFNKSTSLITSFLGKLPDDGSVYLELFEGSIKAADFQKAKEYLLKVISINTSTDKYDKTYLNSELCAINHCIDNETQLNKYYLENPFEKQWKSEYKDGLQLYINFPVNSSTIPSGDFPKLKDLARQITDKGADEYSFKIAGHTDNTGSDIINDPLSIDRAKSVVDYMYTNFNIPLIRMEYNGYGSKQPIADNSTEAGRTKNRRVEITLSANINKPKIAATTILQKDWTRFSDDGNYFVCGATPMQLWDAKAKIKLMAYNDSMLQRAFSPNTKYLAVIAGYGFNVTHGYYLQYVLLIIDVNSGQIIQQQSVPFHKDRDYDINWSPTSSELVVSNGLGNIMLYDVANRKKLKSYSTIGPVMVTYSNNGKYLCILHPVKNGQLEILNAKTLEKVAIKNDMSWPHAIASNYDGKYIVCSNDDRNLYIYNTTDWTYKKMKVSAWSVDISRHPEKNIFVLNDYAGGENNLVEVVDIDKNISIASRDIGKLKYYWQFNEDGSKIYGHSMLKEFIDVLDASTLESVDRIEGASAKTVASFKDENNDQLITVDEEAIHVWDVKTGTKNHFWACKPISIVQLNSKYELLGLNEDRENEKTVFTLYNTRDYSKADLFSIPFEVDKWTIKGDQMVIIGHNFMPANEGSSYGQILVYSLASKSEQGSFSFYLPTKKLTYNMTRSGITASDLSPDGKYVALSTYWEDGFSRGNTFSKIVKIIDLSNGAVYKEIQIGADVTEIAYLSDKRLLVNNWVYDIPTASYVENYNQGLPKSSSMLLRGSMTNTFDFDKLNLRITVASDNTFSFYSKKTNDLVITLVSKRNNEWIAYSNTGEFAASLNGTDRVSWLLGNKRLPFNTLKDKFENPSLIKTKLNALIQNTPVDIVKPVVNVIDPDIFVSPYKLELLTPSDISTKESSYAIKVKATKEMPTLPDPKIVFELNGRKISDKGFGVGEIVKLPTEITLSKTINLQEGTNSLRVFIEYKQAEVEIKTVTLNRVSSQNVNVAKSNSQIWFFGVGIAQYENPSQNLDYADKDILEIATLLKKQEGVLYQKVNTKVLTNEKATEKNARIELNEFLKMASAEDIIIIFLSGHGTQDNDQNLYFVTYDADLMKPYTGMDISKVKNFLANRPINQKALLLLDICHAGAVKSSMFSKGAPLSSEEAIKQLSEGTGSIVLASSTGKEKSFESADFGGGHGAFSYALILALQGEADKVNGDSNGYVSLLEMQSFVSRKVVELTKGDQHPTTPQSSNVRDFPLIRYQ